MKCTLISDNETDSIFRVEAIDEDGGCEVAVFSGPNAKERAIAFAAGGYYERWDDPEDWFGIANGSCAGYGPRQCHPARRGAIPMTHELDAKGLAPLPCPFCGGEASGESVVRYSDRHVREQGWSQSEFYYCNCISCGADNKGLVGHWTRDEAIAAWNRRAYIGNAEPVAAWAVITERDTIRIWWKRKPEGISLYDGECLVPLFSAPPPSPSVDALVQALDEAIGHLGAAKVQSIGSDDQIIMGHVRDAHDLLISARRAA